MSDRMNSCCQTGNMCGDEVCIQTQKVYDSCRDKECVENIRVYLTECGQSLVDRASSVKCRKAEIIWVYSDVEPVAFNRGYYSVDLKFFFKITLDVFNGIGRPAQIEGIASYDKKVILFGSEGNVKNFSSKYKEGGADIRLWSKNNLPVAQTEVVDPICLATRITEPCDNPCNCCCGEMDVSAIPADICNAFDDVLTDAGNGRKLYVTIGLFTIVRLTRMVELVVPVIDFCIPKNECIQSTDSNPCELFEKLKFPVDEFFPPEKCHFENMEITRNDCCCG